VPEFDTVANIVGDAAKEVGLGSVTVSYSSTDSDMLQLLALLKSIGQRLMKEHPWLQLKREATYSVSAASTHEVLEALGVASIIPGTHWDRTNDRPLHAVTPQLWQQLKAVGSTLTDLIKIEKSNDGESGVAIYFTHLTSVTYSGAFEYRCRFWVSTTALDAASTDTPTATTQVLWIDRLLMVAALKMFWLRAKGLPSEAAQQDFEAILETVQSSNGFVTPELSVTPNPYLRGWPNIPERGWS
jgi:hypothetical protein